MKDKPQSEEDRRDIDWAVATARRLAATIDASVFDFVEKLLTADLVAEPRSGFSRSAVIRLAMKIQQFSGPVMAKGLEDTAFYRYNRLLALNEVGGHPHHFGVSAAAFHHANVERARHMPHGMLTTTTHDTKRGEDTRARLAVLSEIPGTWGERVLEWSRILRRGSAMEAGPSRNDEYAFYQLLLGAWPPELTGVEQLDSEATAAFGERLEAVMLKTVREAKLRTGWSMPDTAYEEATIDFVRRALDISRPNPFLSTFLPFQAEVATYGVLNSIVQTVLKLTLPGVPDIYRGAELWDFSLVDPDNRRPVDFAKRESLLEAVSEADPAALLGDWRGGGVKLAVLARLLAARKAHRALFDFGDYRPVEVAGGDGTDPVIAFTRRHEASVLFVAIRRFSTQELPDGLLPSLPDELARLRWRNLLDGRSADPAALRALMEGFPAAVLIGEG